jgi:hypothetical protein
MWVIVAAQIRRGLGLFVRRAWRFALLFILLSVAAALNHPQVAAARAAAGVPHQERQVLLELFTATNGERWTRHDGWGTSLPVCDWYGIWCDFVRVTRIDL